MHCGILFCPLCNPTIHQVCDILLFAIKLYTITEIHPDMIEGSWMIFIHIDYVSNTFLNVKMSWQLMTSSTSRGERGELTPLFWSPPAIAIAMGLFFPYIPKEKVQTSHVWHPNDVIIVDFVQTTDWQWNIGRNWVFRQKSSKDRNFTGLLLVKEENEVSNI